MIGTRRLLLATLLVAHSACAAATPADSPPLTFERDIRPIFKTHCFECHGEAGEHKGGLDLRLRRLAVKGGKDGAALVPGKPGESAILDQLRDEEMPPDKKPKLTRAQIDLIEAWIAQGAPTAHPEPETVSQEPLLTQEDRAYWAFQPVRSRPAPRVKHVDRVSSPIDAFCLEKLEARGLTFAAQADRPTLIRRATFDLTGLPPTPQEVDAFLADASPDAFERVVDRLLASPRYGERWGRHWLDVAGYADSDGGNEADRERKFAWHYRDYVIRAFNSDKPFDQFIVEQLAGDELVARPYKDLPPDAVEKLTATGFLRLAPDGSADATADRKTVANQVIADEIKVVSTALLGMTVGCAQCHDHRYDPISQMDYYRLRAIFEPAYDLSNWRIPANRRIDLFSDADRAKAAQIEAEAAKIDADRVKWETSLLAIEFDKQVLRLPEDLRKQAREAFQTPPAKRLADQKALLKSHPNVDLVFGNLTSASAQLLAEQKKQLDAAAALRARKPVADSLDVLSEVPGKVPAMHLFNRGDCDQPKQEVEPGELAVLSVEPLSMNLRRPSSATSGRRLAYAKWLTSGKHPLVGRVLVNRVWMHHFGRGIVGSPGDFGNLGDRPTHPELLDWLADDFVADGWKLKRLHKLIMLSTAYRQSSTRDPRMDSVDPDNLLLSHYSLQRLDAEEFRDAVIQISGKLNDKMYGPPVPVMPDPVGQFVIGKENLNAGRPGPVIPMNGEEYRRSLYVQVRRSRPLSVLATFDEPTMEPNCDARKASTVAPQSLLLMNSEFVVKQSGEFAARVMAAAGDDLNKQARYAWQLALCSEPTAAQVTDLVEFLRDQAALFERKPHDPKAAKINPSLAALSTLGQALWSANAFLYVD